MKRILAMLCAITVLLSLTACGNADRTLSDGDTTQQIQAGQDNHETPGTSEPEREALAPDDPVGSENNTDPDTSAKGDSVGETTQPNTDAVDPAEKAPATDPADPSESTQSQEQPAGTQPSSQTETSKQPESDSAPAPETQTETTPGFQPEPPVAEEDDNMLRIEIIVGSQTFSATLYDNEAAKTLLDRLPLTLNMSELNGNEKYYYLDSDLPANSSRPSGINTGDLMLYGSNCLVLFYESFSTSYSYTPLGYIDDPAGLTAALGGGSVQVTFQKG